VSKSPFGLDTPPPLRGSVSGPLQGATPAPQLPPQPASTSKVPFPAPTNGPPLSLPALTGAERGQSSGGSALKNRARVRKSPRGGNEPLMPLVPAGRGEPEQPPSPTLSASGTSVFDTTSEEDDNSDESVSYREELVMRGETSNNWSRTRLPPAKSAVPKPSPQRGARPSPSSGATGGSSTLVVPSLHDLVDYFRCHNEPFWHTPWQTPCTDASTHCIRADRRH